MSMKILLSTNKNTSSLHDRKTSTMEATKIIIQYIADEAKMPIRVMANSNFFFENLYELIQDLIKSTDEDINIRNYSPKELAKTVIDFQNSFITGLIQIAIINKSVIVKFKKLKKIEDKIGKESHLDILDRDYKRMIDKLTRR